MGGKRTRGPDARNIKPRIEEREAESNDEEGFHQHSRNPPQEEAERGRCGLRRTSPKEGGGEVVSGGGALLNLCFEYQHKIISRKGAGGEVDA